MLKKGVEILVDKLNDPKSSLSKYIMSQANKGLICIYLVPKFYARLTFYYKYWKHAKANVDYVNDLLKENPISKKLKIVMTKTYLLISWD